MKFYYVTGHGIGPGTIPSDLCLGETLHIIKEVNFKAYFTTSRQLTEHELNWYDIKIWNPESEVIQ